MDWRGVEGEHSFIFGSTLTKTTHLKATNRRARLISQKQLCIKRLMHKTDSYIVSLIDQENIF